MNVIEKLAKNNLTDESIKDCAEIFNPDLIERNYFESIALAMCGMTQLNSKKNIKKEPLENIHPLQLIKLLKLEVQELENEFKTEQEINIQRVLEELGDIAALGAGIIASVRKL